jgi:hypothetical protein
MQLSAFGLFRRNLAWIAGLPGALAAAGERALHHCASSLARLVALGQDERCKVEVVASVEVKSERGRMMSMSITI